MFPDVNPQLKKTTELFSTIIAQKNDSKCLLGKQAVI